MHLSLTLAQELGYDARFGSLPNRIDPPEGPIYLRIPTSPEALSMKKQRFSPWPLFLLCLAISLGCSSDPPDAAKTSPEAADLANEEPEQANEESEPPADPFELGNMIDPFDPPAFEKLLAAHTWEDRPVVDSMQRMRAHQAKLPPPQLTAKEALALHNDSSENNKKILDALGRLAPLDGEGVDFDAEIILAADADLKSTNPLLLSSVVEFDYSSLTGFGLFGFDWKLEKFASSDTVVSWQTSEDRLIDKVVMRDDLVWSDGTPITAHDVVFTFQAVMTDQVVVPAIRQGMDKIRWVEAYDDHTVVFFHKEALSTNEVSLSFPIIPKHAYEKTIPEDPTMARSAAHSKLEDSPIVGGPYRLVKRARGQEFVLQRREEYYKHKGQQVREKPYFKTVRYKVIEDRNTVLLAHKAGKLDSVMLNAQQWNGQTNGDEFYKHNTKATGLEWTSFHFCWNLKTPYFADKRVRQAMSYAMDYEELLNTILYKVYQPSRGTFHATSKMFPENGPEPYQQNLDRAEELLDEAGWADSDGDGIRDKMIEGHRVPFEFTMMVVNYEDRIQIVTLMKECLDSIGILCHVKPTEFTVLTQVMRDRKFQAAYAGWGTGADPDTLSNIFVTNEGRNFGGYSSLHVDALFEKARHEFDEDKRYAIYGEIHKQLWEDQPYTWLFFRSSFYGFSKKLRGYNFSPRGPFHYGPGISSFYMPAAK